MPPKDDGGSKITAYHIKTREEKSKEWSVSGSVSAIDTRFTVKSLKEEKSYYFSVAAENKLGVGEPLKTEQPISPKRPIGLCFCILR